MFWQEKVASCVLKLEATCEIFHFQCNLEASKEAPVFLRSEVEETPCEAE